MKKLNNWFWCFIQKVMDKEVCVDFYFEGEKGKAQVHSASLHYKPFKEEILVDWDNKRITPRSKGIWITRPDFN